MAEKNSTQKPKSGHGRRKLVADDYQTLAESGSQPVVPLAYYHIRSIRTLQCLTEEQNYQTISKVNPKFLFIACRGR